jgi:hypothetical protein
MTAPVPTTANLVALGDALAAALRCGPLAPTLLLDPPGADYDLVFAQVLAFASAHRSILEWSPGVVLVRSLGDNRVIARLIQPALESEVAA